MRSVVTQNNLFQDFYINFLNLTKLTAHAAIEIKSKSFLPDLSTNVGAIIPATSLVTPIMIVAISDLIDEPARLNIVVAKNNTTATPLVCWNAPKVNVMKRDHLLDFTVNISIQSLILLEVSPFLYAKVSKTFSTSADRPNKLRVFVAVTSFSKSIIKILLKQVN